MRKNIPQSFSSVFGKNNQYKQKDALFHTKMGEACLFDRSVRTVAENAVFHIQDPVGFCGDGGIVGDH